jgi:hypothetical protein
MRMRTVMDKSKVGRAVVVLAGLFAATPLLGGCGSDDHHDRYRSSRDYDYGSRPAEYRPDPMPGYNARQVRNARKEAEREGLPPDAGGTYVPDPIPGYNARQVRNARRDAERYDRSYDDR